MARAIAQNLKQDELDPTDILIVLPSAYTSRKAGGQIMAALAEHRIASHLVGVTTSRDEIFLPNSVAITHIFRAKGNEAPMVYIVNSEFGQIGFELNRKRNILFTAITRSRCWVRLFGVGDQMAALAKEVDEVRRHNFELQFNYPTEEQLKKLARVHRDMSIEEKKAWESKFETVADVFSAVLMGDIPLEALPADIQKNLDALTNKSGKRK